MGQSNPYESYKTGFMVAAMEITAGTASFVRAEERGLHRGGSRELCEEWDRGYADCVCAHRLGHDVEDMSRSGLFGPSSSSTPAIVFALLDGKWGLRTRPDPRR